MIRVRDPAELERWVEKAEQMAQVGRAWLFSRHRTNPDALAEALPGFVPGALRRALAPSAGLAVRFLARKYDVPEDAARAVDETLRPILEEIRAAIADRPYLLGTFSFADIAVAATLQAVRPWSGASLGPASREAWTNEAIARAFEDVLTWRDGIYAKHR